MFHFRCLSLVFVNQSDSEILDVFLHTKFRQLKRYSLEGSEAALVGMWAVMDESSRLGVRETVIGMAHRGRTNLLCGLLEFPPSLLFHKIRGHSDVPEGVPRVTGDVISHIGHLKTVTFSGGAMDVRLLHNPSHLEAVNPVAAGRARARNALPFVIHGDAALAGQGVNYEMCQMSKLKDFSSGGVLHLVVNNQIGFTAEASYGRSGRYATDLFKAFEAPIFRASSPLAVLRAARLAARFRAEFHADAVVDVVGFRRYGHNELDEPSFTNPLMYQKVNELEPPGVVFAREQVGQGKVDAGEVAKWEEARVAFLTEEFLREHVQGQMTHLEPEWEPYVKCAVYSDKATGVKAETLLMVGEASIAVDEQIQLHKTLTRSFVEARRKRLKFAAEDPNEKTLDWATCEAMAIGSLVAEGNYVRLCGQDSGRGTFSHRHMEVTCQATGKRVVPLAKLGRVEAVNSYLSELAVVGFEYGISIDSPKNLVIWEAQFGDFFNQAQVNFDTFLSGSHEKWQRPTAMTVILPHGYDGAGPEHSSSRIERFLQMSSEGFLSPSEQEIPNWRIAYPTTPANMFHLLRRQLVSDFRIPLIVIGPKAILRHPLAQSSLSEIVEGTKFQPVIAEEVTSGSTIEAVLWCSGKTYYDLVAERETRGLTKDTHPIVRIEQLVPFPYAEIAAVASNFAGAKRFLWCQEVSRSSCLVSYVLSSHVFLLCQEHENGGAWAHVYPRFYHACQSHSLLYAGRGPLGVPAVGIADLHKKETADYFEAVFAQ